jgi:hypothetical protein
LNGESIRCIPVADRFPSDNGFSSLPPHTHSVDGLEILQWIRRVPNQFPRFGIFHFLEGNGAAVYRNHPQIATPNINLNDFCQLIFKKQMSSMYSVVCMLFKYI